MTTPKRKLSVSLDEDLVAELEAGDEALSAQVDEAVRNQLALCRWRMLGEMLEELEQELGPPDEKLVAKYLELLQ